MGCYRIHLGHMKFMQLKALLKRFRKKDTPCNNNSFEAYPFEILTSGIKLFSSSVSFSTTDLTPNLLFFIISWTYTWNKKKIYTNVMAHNKSGNAPIYFKIELPGIGENVWSKDFLFLFLHIHHT
jgi:hypothetical protein